MTAFRLPADPALAQRKLRVADADVVWLRSVLEGYDGLALLSGDESGTVILTTTLTQASELDALLADLSAEAPLLLLT